MASFDFIDASARGYEFAWRERGYLFRVAIPVLFMYVTCLLAVFVLGVEDQHLRKGLVLMPSFVVEALFVIGLVRYVLYREPIFIWGKMVPIPESEVKITPYQGRLSRKICVQGGIAMYLLIQVVGGGLEALLLDSAASMSHSPSEELKQMPPLAEGLLLFFTLMVFIWSFRLFWLFIPIAMGCPFSTFLRRISGFQISLYMIATWLICSLPLNTFFIAFIEVVSEPFMEDSVAHVIVESILKAGAEIILISVQVAAMTYGVEQILSGKEEKQ